MADDNTNSQRQPPESGPALEHLNALVGEWAVEGTVPSDPPLKIRGRAAFEWLTEGSFLIERWDAPAEAFRQNYFDSRGVSRVYEMSLSDNVWRLWRDSPGFSQRFTGTFSEDGKTITGRWEKSSDGSNREHDFDLTYVKED
jgi:hypothetical protein